MPFSYAQYAGNGSTTSFAVPFPYLLKAHVKVYIGYSLLNGTYTSELVDGTGFNWTSSTQIQAVVAPANGQTLTVVRKTPDSSQLVPWQDGSTLIAADLNTADLQNLYVVQEQQDRNDAGITQSTAAQTAATAATTAANTATSTANTALSTANTALTNANNAVTTSNTASTNASAAVSTANTANTNASAAVTTANTASATASTASTNASAAVTTANAASATAATALSTANTAATNASAAVSTANTASSNASAAVTTANTANTNASNAVTTANTASTNATNAVNTANTASTNASNAVTTANTANTKADQAIAAVSNSINYTLVANVAAIPGSPANNTYIEIADSTGLESFSPLTGRPAGFVGDSGLTSRLKYTTTGSTWQWLNYYANDSDARFLKKSGGTVSGNLAVTGTLTKGGNNVVTIGDTGTVTSAMVADGTLVNADINAAAAIAGTKVSPDFGSQNTTTTGTSTAASFIPTSSTAPTNGVYLPAANSVAISTNGTGRLFVDASGNVGIGNPSPTSKLSLYTNSAANVTLNTGNSVATWGTGITSDGNYSIYSGAAQHIIFSNGASERMRLDSSGRLGLGVSAPDRILHVKGSGTSGTQIQVEGTTDSAGIKFKPTTGNEYELQVNTASSFFVYDRTNSAYRLVINSSGNVGLGTSTPQDFLQSPNARFTPFAAGGSSGSTFDNGVRILSGDGGAGNRPSIQINGNGSSALNAKSFSTYYNNGSTESLYFTYQGGAYFGGSVGIGVTPVEKLHVAGNIYAAGGDVYIDGTNMLSTPNVQPLRFGISLSEKARLTSDGKFLVGTSSARSNFSGTDTPQFQVEGNSFNTSTISVVAAQSAGGGNIELGSTGGTTVGSTGTVSTNGYLGSIHFLGGNGTNLLKAAAIECQVDGTVSGGGAADMPGRLVFSTTSDNASSPTERFKIDRNGSLRSSNVTGTNLVCVNDGASGTAVIYFQTSSVELGKISTNGSNAVTYATSSDYRLKENIIPLENAVARLRQLKPSRFNFLNTPGQTVDGFIAHEAQAVVPECATGVKDEVDADGNPVYQGIDQSKLVPLLTAALQEALAEIESLKARVTALEP
jgi:hypothetical protein